MRQFLHILASPEYAPGTIAVNVTWVERGFNAGQTHCSMYPSIFNRFPVIQPVSSKVRHLAHIVLHILTSPGYRYATGTIAVNVTWMERGFNAGQTHSSIYPSIVNRLRTNSEKLVGYCNFFICIYRPPWGVPIGIPGKRLVLRRMLHGYGSQCTSANHNDIIQDYSSRTRTLVKDQERRFAG